MPLFRAGVLLLGAALLALPASAQTRATRQMVAAAHPLAAQAGLEVLRAGGSAVDAAVAIQMVLTLVEPQSSGIGGGAFLMHFAAAANTTTSWDGRETAPAAATADLFLRDGRPMPFYDAVLGGRSVGVPGVVRMLEAAHRQHGKRPWAELIAPAIRLAEEGFEVSPRLAAAIRNDAERLRRHESTRGYFLDAQNAPLAAGARLRNAALAETLRAIAAQGADALHRGPIAAEIVRLVTQDPNPGAMTMDDLAFYVPRERAPVCGTYRLHRLCGMGPPSSGGVAVLQILGVLEHFHLAPMDPRGADTAHLLAEAGRLAFADRNRFLADADFVPVPVRGLIDPGYITLRAQLVSLDRAIDAPRAGNPPWRQAVLHAPHDDGIENGTSHFAVLDMDGNAVSMTTTVEDAFGARLMARGFILNNELTDFAFVPAADGRPVANRVQGGKRPRSSMAPFLVFNPDGSLRGAVGSPGGARIIGYVARTMVGLIDFGLDPQAAIALPHVVTLGGAVELEEGTPMIALQQPLEARGHRVMVRELNSGLQAIWRTPAGIQGGADPRREGVVVGD
jgi:gamma-glutamyltranspeptidase/glutathione hydrolase